ncbi:hypothetical protein LY76DRAFT_525057, partial [Colletotrichum caudatum]
TANVISRLIAAQCCDHADISHAVAFIAESQQPSGYWLPGTMEGIYVPPCGYRYPLYKFHFTLKALADYVKRYGEKPVLD